MARKTVEVEWLVEKANYFLKTSEPEMTAERSGMASLVEAALFKTGNYQGFTFLASEFESPGILKEGYDTTRRQYFAS